MGRLIDIDELKGCAIIRPTTHEEMGHVLDCKNYVCHDDIPTVYDIEAVVKELEEELQALRNARHKLDDAMLIDKDAHRKAQSLVERELTMHKAIEIVRRGGVK